MPTQHSPDTWGPIKARPRPKNVERSGSSTVYCVTRSSDGALLGAFATQLAADAYRSAVGCETAVSVSTYRAALKAARKQDKCKSGKYSTP
jgi:hypothetical protein